MKGILSFLERAGLVKTDIPAVEPPTLDEGEPRPEPALGNPAPAPATAIAQHDGAPLKLDDIYASEGVGASAYPAERLLRLLRAGHRPG